MELTELAAMADAGEGGRRTASGRRARRGVAWLPALALPVAFIVVSGGVIWGVWRMVTRESEPVMLPARPDRPERSMPDGPAVPPMGPGLFEVPFPKSPPAPTSPASPSEERLVRQRRRAGELFDRAIRLEKDGDLPAAQELLLRLLNDHHPLAQPDGAKEALDRVQAALREPATLPAFFGLPATGPGAGHSPG